MSTNLETKVTSVTVFRDGARVTRTGLAHATPGEQSFIISDITGYAQDDSFRVKGTGAAALRGIDVKKKQLTFEPAGSLKELKAELEKIEKRKVSLTDLIAYQESRVAQLTSISKQFYSEFGKWYAAKESKMDQMTAMDKASMELLRDAKKKLRESREELKEVEAKYNAIQSNISRVQGERRTETVTEVAVTLDVTGETDIRLDLTYQLSNAEWEPNYDVDIADKKARIRRIAMVSNQSLEEWTDVALTVSTASARPVEAVKAEPFYIDVYQPVVLRAMAAEAGGAGRPMPREAADRMMMVEKEAGEEAPPAAEEMAERYAETTESISGTVMYELPGTVTIPSTVEPHPITLTEEMYDSKRLHFWNAYAMREVVAQDEITNGDSVLLPGPTKVYAAGDFIGQTYLAMIAPREKFRLGTRSAYDVKAEKKLLAKDTEKAGISKGKRRREYKYRLAFKNFAKEKIEVKVVDRIPYSSSEKVTVSLQTPSIPYEKSELGIIEWNAAIEPAKELSIDYGFVVEWEQQLEIRPPLP
ncbi:MAG: hypothetical protein C4K47_01840 [Candidatus Thorarchaeota archaeon]|nr:MAG: hypothetical protein C4K47_01840 [Candidatus Thorarchaeota archaeon]